jgi:hypothetical protein
LPPERRIAELLVNEGKHVKAVKESGARRSPDALVDGKPTEFKTLEPGATKVDNVRILGDGFDVNRNFP